MNAVLTDSDQVNDSLPIHLDDNCLLEYLWSENPDGTRQSIAEVIFNQRLGMANQRYKPEGITIVQPTQIADIELVLLAAAREYRGNILTNVVALHVGEAIIVGEDCDRCTEVAIGPSGFVYPLISPQVEESDMIGLRAISLIELSRLRIPFRKGRDVYADCLLERELGVLRPETVRSRLWGLGPRDKAELGISQGTMNLKRASESSCLGNFPPFKVFAVEVGAQKTIARKTSPRVFYPKGVIEMHYGGSPLDIRT